MIRNLRDVTDPEEAQKLLEDANVFIVSWEFWPDRKLMAVEFAGNPFAFERAAVRQGLYPTYRIARGVER